MDVRPALIADAQPPELVQPGQCPLHHPAVDAQATAMFSQNVAQALAQSPRSATLPDGVQRRRLGLPELGLVYGVACRACLAPEE